jgi:hypothetical protein
MASGALSRGAYKNRLYVAGFATYQGMFEIQRESGVVVIEIRANFERRAAARIKPAQHQQNYQGKAGL